jgi:hypothetical protein
VSARQRLRGNDTLVSAQGKFELGFFSPDGSGRFYLGIWYKNIPAQTVIWIGNRVSPLSSVASAELRVSSDTGDLQLLGSSPSDPSASSPRVLWSSNLSSSSAGSSSNVAVMRDDGNLVLLDGGSSSKVLWQSFDYPTDTLIPEAWLGEEKQTGVYQRRVDGPRVRQRARRRQQRPLQPDVPRHAGVPARHVAALRQRDAHALGARLHGPDQAVHLGARQPELELLLGRAHRAVRRLRSLRRFRRLQPADPAAVPVPTGVRTRGRPRVAAQQLERRLPPQCAAAVFIISRQRIDDRHN